MSVYVRRLPVRFCAAHGNVAPWVVDGTDEWWCRECLGIADRAAELVLKADRIAHQSHERPRSSCPFCGRWAA